MNIEEEKKLVIKFMGYTIEEEEVPHGYGPEHTESIIRNEGHKVKRFNSWSPESERKWWDKIWDKMDDEMFEKYHMNIARLFGPLNIREIHTAKPSICWKALIKTLNNL